ncbi:MAG: NAD(+)/NADH kinase [Firmicutes bacterium]|nr:NAD(+)/NADH kinase [Bacillota bacterium]
MTRDKISVFTNGTDVSDKVFHKLKKILEDHDHHVVPHYSGDSDLIVCIGGDGAFLETMHKCDFPTCPIVGINTGHLGFFQEFLPDKLEDFIQAYEKKQYSLQQLNTVRCTVSTHAGEKFSHIGLNEIAIKGGNSFSVHLFISIDGKPIEKFSGDGILVATSAGSTAYNYSLGGSIADPRLKLLQVTPIAPMNTTAYRSFTSSILLPSDLSIGVVPEGDENEIRILNDGIETEYENVKNIQVTASDQVVNLIRFKDYDFWHKVKDKFLETN